MKNILFYTLLVVLTFWSHLWSVSLVKAPVAHLLPYFYSLLLQTPIAVITSAVINLGINPLNPHRVIMRASLFFIHNFTGHSRLVSCSCIRLENKIWAVAGLQGSDVGYSVEPADGQTHCPASSFRLMNPKGAYTLISWWEKGLL